MTSNIGILLLLAILGLVSGMLVNYLADVLPWKRRLVRPFCLSCDTAQSLISYFLWPRRCQHCTTRRSWRTWLVEIIYIGMAMWSWSHPANKINFWFAWMILIYFGVVVLIDIEHRLIMHPVSWAGAGLGLFIGLIRNGWLETLIGGAVGFGLMWLLYRLGEIIMKGLARLRGQSLDDVALGFGDVNLSGVLGLMLGWPLILPGLVLAILIGGLVSMIYLIIMLLLRRYRLFAALPYGPFLIAGAFLLLYFGEDLLIILGN
jgi:leader peptidase (prepilin peptidase)/N-methyltransferase